MRASVVTYTVNVQPVIDGLLPVVAGGFLMPTPGRITKSNSPSVKTSAKASYRRFCPHQSHDEHHSFALKRNLRQPGEHRDGVGRAHADRR